MPTGIYNRDKKPTLSKRKITTPNKKKTIKKTTKKPTKVMKLKQAPELSKYEKAATRLINAVAELNSSLEQCHNETEMAVQMWSDDTFPRRYNYRIYRLTHTTMRYEITITPTDKDGVTDWNKMKERSYVPISKPDKDHERAA